MAINGLSLFRRAIAEGEEARNLARIAAQPAQARSLDQFNKALGQAKDVTSALKDPRVMGVLATALGIPEAARQVGLATRVFLSDLSKTDSLANRMPDSRWKSAAQTLDLFKGGLAALKDPATQAKLAEGLQRAAWNTELEERSPGLGDAVVFQDRAQGVTSTYEILGNAILRKVVTGALGIPKEIVNQSVEAQARAIERRLDVSKLSDPREVQKLAERYLANKALETTNATPAWQAAALAKGITLLA